MKYTLIVECDHDEAHRLEVPLLLDGGESTEEAVLRFKDALMVSRHEMMTHHGREVIACGRIDGKPTPEEESAHLNMIKTLRAEGVLQ